MKLQLVHHNYLTVKALKKRIDWGNSIDKLINVLYICMLSTCIRWFVLKSREFLIPNKKATSWKSQKLIPSKKN